jgi:hypothetical protein
MLGVIINKKVDTDNRVIHITYVCMCMKSTLFQLPSFWTTQIYWSNHKRSVYSLPRYENHTWVHLYVCTFRYAIKLCNETLLLIFFG